MLLQVVTGTVVTIMKALFCHDHYYYHDGSDVRSQGQYHHSVWERYLVHFEDLTVIGRDGGALNDTQGSNISSRDGVTFELFPNANSLKGILSERKKTRSQVRDLVNTHDVIILRGISELGTLAFFEAKRQGKTVAVEVVADAWDEIWNHGSLKAKLYAPYRYLMARYQIAKADAVIYVSQSALQFSYPSKANVQVAASNVQIEKSAFYKKTDAPSAPFQIGMIGTLKNKLKGVHIAIDACRILKDEGIDFTFHILGPGDPAPYQLMVNEAGLQNHVTFDGIRESGTPVYEWLRDLDLYIQPSLQEGVPRAMIEAMAQSLPCIGTNVGGTSELLNERWIIKPGDAQALASTITTMLADPKMMRDEGLKNHARAMDYEHAKLQKIRNDFWGRVASMVARNLQG